MALEDPRMRAAVLWDLYAYPTLQSNLRTALYKLQRAGLQKAASKLLARALPALRSLSQAAQAKDRAAEVSQVPSLAEYARRIQVLVDDGVELLVAYCGGEPEWFNHRGQFRSMFGNCDFFDKVTFNYLEISDHLITRREAQQAFTNMVVEWLEQRVLGASHPAALP